MAPSPIPQTPTPPTIGLDPLPPAIFSLFILLFVLLRWVAQRRRHQEDTPQWGWEGRWFMPRDGDPEPRPSHDDDGFKPFEDTDMPTPSGVVATTCFVIPPSMSISKQDPSWNVDDAPQRSAVENASTPTSSRRSDPLVLAGLLTAQTDDIPKKDMPGTGSQDTLFE